MKKRLLSILLMCCMVLTLLPTAAFAEGSTEEPLVCTCETACTAESMNANCSVCGVEDALPESCGKYVKPADEAVTPPEGGVENGPVCTCETACTAETMNADCPVCGAEGASVENCVKYVKPADDVPTQPEGEPVVLNDGAREVSSAEELIAAVSAGGNIKMMDDITINGDLTIKGPVMLDLNNHELKATRIEINSEFTATGGTINDWVDITSAGGVIKGGTFSGTVVNNNVISGGTFRGTVGNCNLISSRPTSGMPQARITGGDFYGEVTNGPVNEGNASGTISGGSFYGKVTNTCFGMISGGSFYGEVVNNAQRTFLNGIPYGCITGGTFYKGLTDNSTGDYSAPTCTVTYLSFGSEYARQVVPNGKTATAPADPKVNGFTFLGWYTDENFAEGSEYTFTETVTENITLYAKWQGVSYNLRITDKNGDVYYVTSENAHNVLDDDGTVVYTPGYVDANKNFTTDDWNKALRGETVKGIQLPKLTLNGANLQSIRMEGVYGDDGTMRLLSTMLQIELVGDNKINCRGDDAIFARMLLITGTGSLNATATGQNAAAIAVESEGGRYYQYGGDVTLDGEYSGIYCTEAVFEFAAGKLTANSPRSALYCELSDLYFKITSDTTTFFCGTSEQDTFEIQKPFDPENIHRQLKEKQCYFVPIPENETILYAQLISNHKVSFDAGNGDVIDDQTIVWGEKATAPEAPVRRGYTFAGWYLDENEFNFDTPVTKDLTLTAKWTANQYTITFDTDGGSAIAPITQDYGTDITAPANPTKNGYTFAGWTPAIPETMPAENLTVTAQWRINQYTITFDTDGGSAIAPITQGYGTAITAPADPTKNGYTFVGWNPEIPATMPAEDLTVTAQWTLDRYTISYNLNNGTATGNPDSYTVESDAITLNTPTRPGYTFTGWSGTGLTGENNLTVTIEKGSTGDRSYTAHWRYNGGGSSGYSYYTIKATAGTGGSISPSGNVSVREGRDQTFTITPDKGYAVSNVKIDGKSIGAVKSYTFENVSKTHTIEVIFMKANGNPQTGVFVDVATGSYYEDAVDWAVENGITQGTDDTHFSPDGICTRAQAVTFLWRTAGSPEPETRTMPFTDVPVGSYYYDAVLWAVENGITKGTSDTTFSPNMTCSRAQIVTFLWRSEKSPAAGTANPFADVKSTAYYADAVLWAVKEDITKGTTNTTFSHDADCTRAQIVTFLWRCKK